jgi:hypothetical protein
MPGDSMSFSLDVPLPPALLQRVAEIAADIVLARLADAPTHWMTLDEAAIRYRSTPGALRKRAQRGQLPGAIKDGARWLVHAPTLDAALLVADKIEMSRNGASAARTAPPPAGGGTAPHAF